MGKSKTQQEQSSSSAKRKVSCLPCRLKKVKCDGNKPCQRCQAKDTECHYAKPAPVGRPPKNAVVNKLILARNEAPTRSLSSSLCKEFIFENVSYTKTTPNNTSYLFSGKDTGLQYYIKDIYSSFFGPENSASNELIVGGQATKSAELLKLVSSVKMYDMLQYFTWMTSDVINIILRRFSRLSLDNYIEPDFTLYSLQIDQSKDFFDDSATGGDAASATVNPLNSLPPQQAMRFIECFFCIHPYSLMFNKTMILQSYWTDSADPLLMTVIYGTTVYISQLLEGKPVALWETVTSENHRNPFLNYAYVLINKASAEASLSRYQAIILLALFEVTFGFAKRGMSLFALGHMIATRVGLFFKNRPRMSDIEEEACLMTFWSAYNCTMRGCIEMDQVPREVLNKYSRPFPPATLDESSSYQFDQENNNSRMFKSYHYLVESFYCESVISQFSSRLFGYFPESKDNIFRRRPSFIPTALSTSTAISLAQVDIEEALNNILDSFSVFIEHNRHRWTPQQQYTIEATCVLYKIHFSFLKLFVVAAKLDGIYESRPHSGSRRHGRIPVPIPTTTPDMETPIDLDDIEVVIRMHLVVPMAIDLLEKTHSFLGSPLNYNNQAERLPHGLVASALETSAKILILKYRRDPWDIQSWNHLEAAHTLTTNHRWASWTSMLIIEKQLKEFFQKYPAPPSGGTDSILNSISNINNNLYTTDTYSSSSSEAAPEVLDNLSTNETLESSVSPAPISFLFEESNHLNTNTPGGATAFSSQQQPLHNITDSIHNNNEPHPNNNTVITFEHTSSASTTTNNALITDSFDLSALQTPLPSSAMSAGGVIDPTTSTIIADSTTQDVGEQQVDLIIESVLGNLL
ncbi:hypothetical protein BDA99DRAFT_516425 [Phascolomyces articulosus]|uniref:Zn(2)-C6 fungal-type domain-containing protein n=1 Tax=Phascolomyces articulosus TaxID=60185 RepID=A0AAD5K4Y9_9FUNG|nr:hypothetical protein BDA99DRAFT_516425 [Phascolomyces articulosus]